MGGRRMSNQLVDTIINEMWWQHPRPQCHVVIMGDNNLRWLEDDYIDIVRMMINLVWRARDVPNCHVMVSTLMPSIENQDINQHVFRIYDEMLRKETIINPKYELLDLSKSLRSKDGSIKEKYFQDQVHLNESGAEVVARQIFNKVSKLPNIFF